ncbi:FAD-dependent oxidoreductase [Streptomyces sp. NPDC005728]|uniref:FAD-dependent oxidoreductase n=1 Tax=Streptomyces sp. NPDC005728 TaxID=3157054 RepID=UPI0033CA3BED
MTAQREAARVRRVDVLVVGAGPAGLAAAARLAAAGAGRVEVLEREARAGGVPRHCAHGGFGTWTHPLTGPGYARLLTEAATRAGAVLRTGVTVLDRVDPGPVRTAFGGSARTTPDGSDGAEPGGPDRVGPGGPYGTAPGGPYGTAPGGPYGTAPGGPWWTERGGPGGMPTGGSGAASAPGIGGAAVDGTSDQPRVFLTTVGPGGPETIAARAVVLATGSRERPRAARLVPGTRPAGVYTTGELQQAVHLFGQTIGTRAVVVGAQDVSYAAADTVRASGAVVVALVTDRPRAGTTRARAQWSRLRRRVPLLTDTTVTELLGHGRLSGVRVRHRDGRTAALPCDTVVFTGDFVPDDELARRGGITLDTSPYTSRTGVFAAGAVLRPGQRAGAATRDGAETAGAVLEWLAEGDWPRPLRPGA